jgi:hypothetical protein
MVKEKIAPNPKGEQLELFSCTIMIDALCKYSLGVVLAFEGWEKSNVLLGAVGKAKTTGAVGVRWEGRALGVQFISI